MKKKIITALTAVLYAGQAFAAADCEHFLKGAAHGVHGSKTEEFMAKNTAFVAADGAEAVDEARKMRLAPRGSAVLTSSGRLADSGITAIIHAATGAMESGPLLDPTLKSVAASVANALALARANGHRAVALPFIGGKIFLERIGVTPEQLSAAIVESIVKNHAGLAVKVVAFDARDAELFRRALKPFSGADNVSVVQGSITDFKTHGCSAIVNAANMELLFGGGVSGVIERATGAGPQIEEEAARKLNEFYRAQDAK